MPAGLWAAFTCRGNLPVSIQNLVAQIWTDWLPNQDDLELAGNYSLEVYDISPEQAEERVTELWLPVKLRK